MKPVGTAVKRPTTSNTVVVTTRPTGGKKWIKTLMRTKKKEKSGFRFQEGPYSPFSKEEAIVISGLRQIRIQHLNGEYKRIERDPFKFLRYETPYTQQDTVSGRHYYLFKHIDLENTGKGLANVFKRLFSNEKIEEVDIRHGWFVGDDLEKRRGWLHNPNAWPRNCTNVSECSSRAPLEGWQESYGNGSFVPAPHITVRLGGLDPCREVRVSSRRVKEGVRSLGVYLPTGEWSRGRPVYRQVEQPHLYMLVATGRRTWSTRISPDSPTAWMVSSDRGGNSPGDKPVEFVFGWMHSGDNELRDDAATWGEMKEIGWRDDAGIDVTCVCDARCT